MPSHRRSCAADLRADEAGECEGGDDAQHRDENPQAVGVILGGHGITAWGDTSEESERNSLWIIDTATAKATKVKNVFVNTAFGGFVTALGVGIVLGATTPGWAGAAGVGVGQAGVGGTQLDRRPSRRPRDRPRSRGDRFPTGNPALHCRPDATVRPRPRSAAAATPGTIHGAPARAALRQAG